MRFWVIGLLFLPLLAGAATYKCTDDKGRPVYQQNPCAEGGEEMDIKVRVPDDPAPAGGLRDSERTFLEQQQAEDRANKIAHWEKRVRDLTFERDQAKRDHDALVAKSQTGNLSVHESMVFSRLISRSNEKLKVLDQKVRNAETRLRRAKQ